MLTWGASLVLEMPRATNTLSRHGGSSTVMKLAKLFAESVGEMIVTINFYAHAIFARGLLLFISKTSW